MTSVDVHLESTAALGSSIPGKRDLRIALQALQRISLKEQEITRIVIVHAPLRETSAVDSHSLRGTKVS